MLNQYEQFEPKCLLPLVGVRAVWSLYRNGHWDLLKKLGVDRSEAEPVFDKYEEDLGPGNRLNKRDQVEKLTVVYPQILEPALRLNGMYMIVYSSEVKFKMKEELDARTEREYRSNPVNKDMACIR